MTFKTLSGFGEAWSSEKYSSRKRVLKEEHSSSGRIPVLVSTKAIGQLECREKTKPPKKIKAFLFRRPSVCVQDGRMGRVGIWTFIELM